MASTYIKTISVGGVAKQIDYTALANLPTGADINYNSSTTINTKIDSKQDTLSDTDGGYGQRVKAIEDALAAAIDFEAQSY